MARPTDQDCDLFGRSPGRGQVVPHSGAELAARLRRISDAAHASGLARTSALVEVAALMVELEAAVHQWTGSRR
ncbi:hypothetical protein [Maricaulis sp. CAU 1757]